MEEATGAPSSFAVSVPKRLRASGRDGETVMTEPPSPLRMLLSRHTKRREFITLLGGAAGVAARGAGAAASERAASACSCRQPRERSGRTGTPSLAFLQALQQLGWTDGRNVRIDYRWGRRPASMRFADIAAELVALTPDVIVASGTSALGFLLLSATRDGADRVRQCRRPGRQRASLTAWRGRAATPPDSSSSNTA